MYAASVSCFQGWIVREVLESVHAYRHKTKEKKRQQKTWSRKRFGECGRSSIVDGCGFGWLSNFVLVVLF